MSVLAGADYCLIGVKGNIAFLSSGGPQVDGFVAGLRALGYRDGENIRFTILSADNASSRLGELFS